MSEPLTAEMKDALEAWMERQRIDLASIIQAQVVRSVTVELAKRQQQHPWWGKVWLWLSSLVWKYNPNRILARRRHAARDDDAQWEYIGALLTKAMARPRQITKLRPGYLVKGYCAGPITGADPSLPSRSLTLAEDAMLERAFAQVTQTEAAAAATPDVVEKA